MKDRTKRRAGLLVAIALILDGCMHLYWAMGNVWPATDEKTLSLNVLNLQVSFGPLITLPLAVILFAGALMILARIQMLGWLGTIVPGNLLQLGMYLVSAGLLLRSLAGIVWILGIGSSTETPFYWLNLFAYTPACLLLLLATVLASFSERQHRTIQSVTSQGA